MHLVLICDCPNMQKSKKWLTDSLARPDSHWFSRLKHSLTLQSFQDFAIFWSQKWMQNQTTSAIFRGACDFFKMDPDLGQDVSCDITAHIQPKPSLSICGNNHKKLLYMLSNNQLISYMIDGWLIVCNSHIALSNQKMWSIHFWMGDAKKMLDSSANLRLDKYAKMLNIMQKKKKKDGPAHHPCFH